MAWLAVAHWPPRVANHPASLTVGAPTYPEGPLRVVTGNRGKITLPKYKNPARRAAKRGVVVNNHWLSPGRERDVSTPRPSRPADLEGEGVKLLLSPRRGPLPSSGVRGMSKARLRRHREQPWLPRPAAKRHGLGSQSRHPEHGRTRRRSCRSRPNTSRGRPQSVFQLAYASAMKPCDHAIR
jgi:hypothetical protein